MDARSEHPIAVNALTISPASERTDSVAHEHHDHSSSSSSHHAPPPVSEKRANRLKRKAELARQCRDRKRQYIEDLEATVKVCVVFDASWGCWICPCWLFKSDTRFITD